MREKKLRKAVAVTLPTPNQPAFTEEAGDVTSNGLFNIYFTVPDV